MSNFWGPFFYVFMGKFFFFFKFFNFTTEILESIFFMEKNSFFKG